MNNLLDVMSQNEAADSNRKGKGANKKRTVKQFNMGQSEYQDS